MYAPLTKGMLFTRIRSFLSSRNDVRKVKRLTDSEITSITWAMHRIKRRDEELQKDIANKRHKRNNGNEPNVLTGTVQNHIARRNSYLAPLSEERLNTHSNVRDQPYKKVPRHSDIDRNTSRKPVHGKIYNSRIARQDSENDILPYHNYVEHSFPRLMRISKNSTEPNESSGGNLIHLEGIYRPSDHPVYYERRMYPQIGRLVTPADAIQLYGGTSAYFNTKQISEPMYI